jgi:predicted nucleic acid-binding protein
MLETIVITDTSCLIALSKVEVLDILHKLYKRVVVSKEIAEEFAEPLPLWFEIREASNKNYQRILENTLDKGESSAIALAFDLENVVLVLDDLKARKEAQKLGFKITGTLGILFSAKEKNIISSLKLYLDKLQQTDFRIAENIVSELLKMSNECE